MMTEVPNVKLFISHHRVLLVSGQNVQLYIINWAVKSSECH